MSRHRTRQDHRSTNPTNHQPHKRVGQTMALTVALATSNVLAASDALAQDKEAIPIPPVEVQEQRPGYIVPNLGTSRIPGPIRDIPQSITVVPQELMQQQGVSNLQDALRNVTGISFQAGEGGEPRETISRCAGSTRAMIFSWTACAIRDPTFGMFSISRLLKC